MCGGKIFHVYPMGRQREGPREESARGEGWFELRIKSEFKSGHVCGSKQDPIYTMCACGSGIFKIYYGER